MKIVRWLLGVGIVALAMTAAAAQTGGITVQVVGSNGEPLPGATVTIANESGFIKTTAQVTGAKGIVDFPVLRPSSDYVLEVSFPGMTAVRIPDIRVRVSQTRTEVIQLVEEFQERVKVKATRDVVDLAQTENSTRFSDDFIQDLPVPGRFYQNVLTMAPGVQDADGDGNPNVHGSRSRDFKAVVSGVSNVDPLTGQWMSRVNPNSIEELEVVTSGAGVEFGRAQGGFARIIQKQGSNEHEGVFEFYYRSSKLDGTGAVDTSNLPDNDFDWIQPSVQFSGPIVKDKLWYRLSHEIRKIEQPINVISGIATTDFNEGTHSDQITWQVSPRNKLALQFQSDPQEITNFGISSRTGPDSAQRRDRTGETYSLTWTAPVSPKVLVETTLSWQDLNTGIFPTTMGSSNECLGGADFLEQSQCFNAVTGDVTGSYFQTWDDHRQRLTVKSDATVYGGRFWGMSHQFKFGMIVENERYFRSLERRSTSTFFVITNPASDPNGDGEVDPEELAFGFANVRVAIPPTDEVRATGSNWGFYAEDQIKPLQNLTITVGARVDREEVNSDGFQIIDPVGEFAFFNELVDSGTSVQNAQSLAFTAYEDFRGFIEEFQETACAGVAPTRLQSCREAVESSTAVGKLGFQTMQRRGDNINIVNTNVSPFLSLSWDPWSTGKNAFKLTGGRYYNNTPLILPLIELNPATTDVSYRVNLVSGQTSIDGAIEPAVNVQGIQRDLRTPFQDEFTFSYERELFTETALKVTYISRKYKDQVQDINANLDIGDYGTCVRQTTRGGPTLDTSGGPDGIIDDCIGEVEVLDDGTAVGEEQAGFGGNTFRVQRPDGVADLYIQNPFWGDMYYVGNLNKIDYQSYVVELTRRQYRSWEMNASYTWSEAKGDGEDFFQVIGDDPSLLQDEKGYQSYDQRHVVKLNATTITPWGIRLGTSASWQSGLPYSVLRQKFSQDACPPTTSDVCGSPVRTRSLYLTGQRNSERNDSYWNFDLKATKELTLGRGMNMQVSAEVFNAFNDGTYLIYNPDLEIGQQVNGVNDARRRFGRRWQVGLKLAF